MHIPTPRAGENGAQAVDQVFYGVLTSAIVGILSWGGGQVLSRASHRKAGAPLAGPQPYQSFQPYQPYPWTTPAAQPARKAVNPSQVLLHMALLQFIVNVVGFVVGFVIGAAGASAGANPQDLQGVAELLVIVFGTLTAIVFFFVIGLRLDRALRWRHLTYVALGTVLLTLIVNFIVTVLITGEAPLLSGPAVFIAAIVLDTIQAFVAMGIGGGLAALVGPKPAPAPVPTAVPQSYAPAPGTPYPYGYGAPPSTPYPYGYGTPPSTPMYPPPPGTSSGVPMQPGYPATPSSPQYPPPGAPGVPGAAPGYPPYSPQYPPPSAAQAPGAYQPGWSPSPPAPAPGQPPANPVAPPPAAYPVPQQPPGHENRGAN